MLNQIVCIQFRYIDVIIRGCLTDGFAAAMGTLLRRHGEYSDSKYFSDRAGDRTPPTTTDVVKGVTKRVKRMWHWHLVEHCWQLQQQ